MTVTIQAANLAHSGELVEVLHDAANWLKNEKQLVHWYRHCSTWNNRYIHEKLNSLDVKVLVAIDESFVVGLVSIQSFPPDYHPRYSKETMPSNIGYISKLAVRTKHTRQGIGQKLLMAAELFILNSGQTVAALDWYKKAEFLAPYYVQRGYILKFEDSEGFFAEKNIH
jgi:ribosomal protein S18 acetylase RimI-like enzyme